MAMHRQHVQWVQKLITALPEDLRHPLVLSAMEEMNSRQISQVLDIQTPRCAGASFAHARC